MEETGVVDGPRQTPLTRAMATIRALRQRLDEQEGVQPIAVVGIGLRLPGGIDGPADYWAALAEGRDLVRPLPAHRKGPFGAAWEGLPQRGGFLDEVLDFDAEFFGISPREARHLDPQHRLLLEVAWEAMENAALPAERLSAARAGFYLGIMWQDYREWVANSDPDAYWTTGNGHNFAAGRIAYSLGLTGPTLAVDTACSSSLVAVHLATQALRRGECEVAFAAGVNLIMSPRTMRLVQQTRSLSPDGVCRTFDARANGFVRGEGCGVVVLKRLDHAQRDGDRIHAVIRGSAVNQDGRSTGFTAPNPLAQVALIESALAASGLEPSDIGYVETHGTGTSLGDPIELEALATALGRRNGGAPLAVGAVKTNMGHLESAAGVAGLVKAILCLRERRIPPVVHFRTLNPRIDLSGTGITIPRQLVDWPQEAGRYAAVSSFGMSGTNAHVILGAPEPQTLPAAPGETTRQGGSSNDIAAADASAPALTASELTASEITAFEISARTAQALRELAGRYARVAERLDPADFPAFVYTATEGRSRHDVSVRIETADPARAAAALRAVAENAEPPAAAPAAFSPPALPRRVLDLPTYPWQRERFAPQWPTATEADAAAQSGVAGESADAYPTAHQLVWTPAANGIARTDRAVRLAGNDRELLETIARACAAASVPVTLLGDGPAAPEPAAVTLLAMKATPLPDRLDPAADPASAAAALCLAVTDAARAASRDAAGSRVFAVTRASCRVSADDLVAATDHGLLLGLSPVLGLELGPCWGGVIDLAAEPGPADAAALVAFVTAAVADDGPFEDLAAVRDAAVHVARIRAAAEHEPHLPVRDDATYLVTGGLGAVGRELVSQLVERGARHLLLIGRRAEPQLLPEAAELLERMRGEGVRIEYRSGGCDTPEALASALTALGDMPQVRGVVHAAGTLRRTAVADVAESDFAEAFQGKAAGAWWLHLAARAWTLDFFTLVSSVSAQWGTEGCAAYSAANAALDTLAAHRVSLGLPAASIAYGPWQLGGEGMADAALREKTAKLGVGALDARSGRAALTARTPGIAGHVIACPLDLPRLAQVMSGLRPRGLFAEAQAVPAPSTPVSARELSIAAELAALTPRERAESARRHVTRLLAEQLGYDDPARVRRDVGFFDLGLDSIAAVDLAARLSQAFEVTVASADLFDRPTVDELAAFLLAAPAAVTAAPPVTAPSSAASTGTAPTGTAPAGTAPAGTAPNAAAPAAHAQATTVSTAAPASAGESSAAAAYAQEPVAIVGMAGRFPQAGSVEEFWDLLRDGRDPIARIPADRFDVSGLGDGVLTTDQGGFLRDIDRFDASFFGIPAREAESLDPQQRLLLESAWHALEDAAIDPKSLKGSRTGVYVGVSYSDYARLLAAAGTAGVDAYYGTGTALNAVAGRLSFTLGLGGPAVAVDTACSSSLVALHLAVRSLRSGETDAALAGGVNILLDPASWIAVSQAHMLSPEGRCKTFSADANGFVRSEGCGVLVLKRLSDAQRDGDRVLAVIRGSAVNQDGASSGLTAPSGRAQELLLTQALEDARLTGAEVSYLEAHGTGTSLGDPIELAAAWRVLGPGRRPGEPLHVGSVKSNIGHCESAAGVAGVIKAVLALRHDVIPGDLHFGSPNPQVDWSGMNVRVVEGATAWRRGGRPRIAGVSGFGFTGTNAHIVLAEAPEPAPAEGVGPATPAAAHLIPLSAPDADGLDRLAGVWRRRLENAADGDLAALAASAGAGRAHFPYRGALQGRDREQLLAALDGETWKAAPPATRSGGPRVAFLFSGQGSQYFGMGRELYENEPVFREVFDACDRALSAGLGDSLARLVYYGDDPALLNETRVTQPALVALETALAALWESWGVTPAVVMGHSVGEIAAAIHAGVMEPSTGLSLIAERARLMQATERGAMLAVVADERRATEWAAEAGLDIAAINGPEAIVLSGDPGAVAALAARLKEQGVRNRALSVSHAFHSRLLDPMLDEFTAALRPMRFNPPQLPIISNLSGRTADRDTEFGPEYWREHARRPVRFHAGARRLAELEVDLCLEIGPDRTLVNLVSSAGLTPAGGVVSSLRRGTSDRAALLNAARTLYLLGQDLNWREIHHTARPGSRSSDAPRYPFADTRYWPRAQARQAGQPAASPVPVAGPAGGAVTAAPPWGALLRSPALRGRVFATQRSCDYPAHLTDHRLYGVVSVPGASQTATVLSALGAGAVPVVLEDLHFPRALVLREAERYDVQIIESEQEHGTRTVSLQSLLDPERGRWQEHLAARIAPAQGGTLGAAPVTPDPAQFAAGADRHLSGTDFYRHLHALGYHLGPSFRWIDEAWIRGDQALIAMVEPQDPREDPADYEIHPGLLDSCLQSSVVFAVSGSGLDDLEQEPGLAIPFAVGRLAFPGRPARGERLWCHVRAVQHEAADDGLLQVESADLHLFGESSGTVFTADGFRFRRAARSVLERSLRERTQHAYELVWTDARTQTPAVPDGAYHVVVLGEGALASTVAEALDAFAFTTRVADPAQAAQFDAELVVDARFAAPQPGLGASDALANAAAVAQVLRELSPRATYAVLAEDADASAPVHESLWGMLASAEAELADRRLLRVTLAEGWEAGLLGRALTCALDDGVPETRLEIGRESVRVARLVACADGSPDADRAAAERGGAALITGGLGALGLSAARFLAARGVAAITLMSRSAPDETAQAVIRELAASGTLVRAIRGDVTKPEDCRAAVAEAGRDAPLRTVLHLAGVSRDQAFEQLTTESFAEVFAAKAGGAAALAEALRDVPLDALVFFSSASAVLGSAGQANYAAANGYLDGLARALRAGGMPAVSVDWGPWIARDKGGLAAGEGARRAIAQTGLKALTDDEAREVFDLVLSGRHGRLVAVAADPQRYLDRLGDHPRAAFVREALSAPGAAPAAQPETDPATARGWLRGQLAGLDDESREQRLRQTVRAMAGEVLGDPAAIDDDERGFAESGLDSIMVIDLRTKLSHALGQDLPATVALDHPDVSRLTAHLTAAVFAAPAPAPAGASAPATTAGAVPAGAATQQSIDITDDDGEPGAPPDDDLDQLSFEELVLAVQADMAAQQ
jgi:acyl transferase domain-containing protein/acyl carrier protein/methylmalonyl-CoA mutase cobalamin-binding subunit